MQINVLMSPSPVIAKSLMVGGEGEGAEGGGLTFKCPHHKCPLHPTALVHNEKNIVRKSSTFVKFWGKINLKPVSLRATNENNFCNNSHVSVSVMIQTQVVTRMHSSRMGTVRCSDCLLRRGVSTQGGVCPPRGVCLPGVPLGGCLLRGCLPRVSVCLGGGSCLPRGCLPRVGCLPRGVSA